MYVSRVYVENIKSFHGPRVVDLTLTRPDGTHAGWTVLAGRNGSGKTTLLRALALALSGRHTCSTRPLGGQSGGLVLRRLRTFPAHGRGSGEVQRLMLASGPVARQASLFHEDASLAEGVAWLIEQHLRALEGREGAAELKRAALSVLGHGLLPDGYRVEDVDSEGLWVTRDGHRYPLREMSDGFRTVAALVVDLLKQIHDAFGDDAFSGDDGEAGRSILSVPGVVIIDEIDAHLHVSWQRRIGPWLTEHFPNIQFIVTTHSPYICQAADPGGLIRLPGVEEDAAPEVVSEDLYERVVYGSGDDAVLSELFGLDTPYSEQAERRRAEFVALESRVYEGDTSPETVERYKQLKELLTSSPAARVHEMSARLHRLSEGIGDGEGGEAE
ncbi:ATP-binding protein [Streptomyces sp. HCCB10043]|nr:ATP-binding protein [Streptomyces filamentosus NRRL 15998]ESU47756.1 ATP-binding protein [Streptomyces sp. HCCB10043]EWS91737.1 ATP-binding protein [Streptomyces filamentosus NRRL 11379]MYR78755.1 AAA family ATPase [Streptomyces sp. SID5466]